MVTSGTLAPLVDAAACSSAGRTFVSGWPSRHDMYSTKRVLPQARRALEEQRYLLQIGGLEEFYLVAGRNVVRLVDEVVLLDDVAAV